MTVVILVHHDALVTALKHVRYAAVAAIESLGIYAVQPAHPGNPIGLGRFDEPVIVIVYQAVGVAAPALLPDLPAEHIQK